MQFLTVVFPYKMCITEKIKIKSENSYIRLYAHSSNPLFNYPDTAGYSQSPDEINQTRYVCT